MSFTSLLFLTGFLPVSVLLYKVIRSDRNRDLLLVILSWLFYAWAGLQGLVLLLILTVWIWTAGRQLALETGQRRKILFWISVGFPVVILILYKYLDPWLQMFGQPPLGLMFPLGISFYTFSAISYLADVYLNRCAPQASFLQLALYLSFFPKVSQGPIVQYHQFAPELERRTVTFEDRGSGALKFMRGLAKKVILADGLAHVVTGLQTDTSFAGAWILSVAYALELYFDFSGYSDMAIGMGRWFGFHIPENFNHPYTADSVRDFWRRWHISLSSWFRDYVYIPLGGSRAGREKLIRNLLVVWLLTGIWHGPNLTFVIWGLYYGLLIILERFVTGEWLEKLPRQVRILLIFLVADIGWVFFAAPDLMTALARLGYMTGIGITGFASMNALFWLRTYALLFILGFLCCGTLPNLLESRILERWKTKGMIGLAVFWTLVLVACAALIIGGTSRTFLYFAF